MSEPFPYTDEQLREYARVMWGGSASSDVVTAKRDLTYLLDAGITVTFPEPRYGVVVAGDYAYVVDRHREQTALMNVAVAMFNRNSHPDAQRAADVEAKWLNGDSGVERG